jgi:predicted Zn-dependent protease
MGNHDEPKVVQALHFLTIGSFPRAYAEDLVARISRRVSVPCRLSDSTLRSPLPLLPEREQLDADALLTHLEKGPTDPGTIIIGLTLLDIGVRIFTFVFGQARHNGFAALVSLARLKPEFYGLAPDSDLTLRRAVTEILHELGHIAGLTHCVDFDCLMHFAANVESIDLRGASYCDTCKAALPPGLRVSWPRDEEPTNESP